MLMEHCVFTLWFLVRLFLVMPKCVFTFISIVIDFMKHIVGAMVSVLASSAVDHGFESRSGQTKD